MRTEPIRRHRVVQTCRQCRNSKVRCDQANPTCSRCLRLSLACLYSSNDSTASPRRNITAAFDAPTSGTTTTNSSTPSARSSTASHSDQGLTNNTTNTILGIAAQNSRAKSLITSETLSLNVDVTADVLHQPLPPKRNRGTVTCIRCRRLKVRCDRRRPCGRCIKFARDVYCSYGEQADPDGSELSPTASESASSIETNFFHTNWAKKHRYTGHWTSLLHVFHSRFPSLHPRGDVGVRPPPRLLPLPMNYPFDNDIAAGGSLHGLLSQLPPRPVLEAFVGKYLSTVNTLCLVIYRPSFNQDLGRHWAGKQPVSHDWMALFLTVLALGCQVNTATTASTGSPKYSALPSELLRAAAVYLKRTPFMFRPTTHNIRTLCLMVIAKQYYSMSCHAADTCWPLTGLIVRLAIGMGLNRPQDYTIEKQREVRQLWTAVVFMDLKQSLLCGMPLILRVSDLQGFSLPVDQCDNNDEAALNDLSLVEKLLPATFPTLSRVIELANLAEEASDGEEIIKLDAELRKHLKGPEVTSACHEERPVDFQACMLDSLFRRALLILHSRFAFQHEASVTFPLSYISSLECSLAVLFHQRALCEQRSSSKQPLETAWIAGLLKDNFFTAAMTICIQLDSNGAIEGMGPFADAKKTILDALQSCRDLWSTEKDMSSDTVSAFEIIDRCLDHLRSTSRAEKKDDHLDSSIMAQWGGKSWVW